MKKNEDRILELGVCLKGYYEKYVLKVMLRDREDERRNIILPQIR